MQKVQLSIQKNYFFQCWGPMGRAKVFRLLSSTQSKTNGSILRSETFEKERKKRRKNWRIGGGGIKQSSNYSTLIIRPYSPKRFIHQIFTKWESREPGNLQVPNRHMVGTLRNGLKNRAEKKFFQSKALLFAMTSDCISRSPSSVWSASFFFYQSVSLKILNFEHWAEYCCCSLLNSPSLDSHFDDVKRSNSVRKKQNTNIFNFVKRTEFFETSDNKVSYFGQTSHVSSHLPLLKILFAQHPQA